MLSNKFATKNGDQRVMMLFIVSDAEVTDAQLKRGKKSNFKELSLVSFFSPSIPHLTKFLLEPTNQVHLHDSVS